jgi:Ca2+-binding RTX toxin-like protein
MGSNGDDAFVGGAGNDFLAGGSGTDMADYSGASAGATVDLHNHFAFNDGQGGWDYLIDIENITGTAFNDYLSGNAGDNVFKGGAGNDTFVGGAGSDTADYRSASSNIYVNLAGYGVDGQGGTDFLAGIENVTGSAFADTLIGDGNANRIEGAAGNDFMAGNAGADNFVFNAGSGFDTITDFSKTQGDKIVLKQMVT